MKNFFSQPNDEMLEELFDEVYGTNTGGPTDEADGGGGTSSTASASSSTRSRL